jgi:hypothetical protein
LLMTGWTHCWLSGRQADWSSGSFTWRTGEQQELGGCTLRAPVAGGKGGTGRAGRLCERGGFAQGGREGGDISMPCQAISQACKGQHHDRY